MSAQPVMVAMSGGVDSSVAAALLLAEGSEVVGVTLRLWGGESDSGCCAVSDVDDARRVCDALGIEHHVFNLGDDFDRHVVAPYVAAHATGLTPNPCIECNRHVKFDRLLDRTRALGFERLATGHHARVAVRSDGTRRIARPADPAKDQSYVLHMLGQDQLSGLELPIGDLTKGEVRQRATSLGLRTAGKPDSQDVCFITREHGRGDFLSRRIPLTPGRVVDATGTEVGRVDAIELVTVGNADDLLVDATPVGGFSWADGPVTGPVLAQVSAHGAAVEAQLVADSVRWSSPHRRVAPGQSVVFYEGEEVLGGAVAT